MTDSPITTVAPAVDPVAEIGREIERLNERMDVLDVADNRGDSSTAIYRRSELDDVHDRIDCLQAYASTLRASSVEGALVQLSIAAVAFARLTDLGEKETYERKKTEIQFDRLMYSVVSALADDPKIDAPALGVYRHMGEHLDPWLPFETRVAMIEDRQRRR